MLTLRKLTFWWNEICSRGNDSELTALESCFGWVESGYYESPFSTTTNSVTNLRLNSSFCDVDDVKNDGNVFKLEKKTFFNITPMWIKWNSRVYC